MRSMSKRALLLAVLAGAAISSGDVFAKERRSSNGNNSAMQLQSNKTFTPMQVMKYNQTTTSTPIVRDHRVIKPLTTSSGGGGVTVTNSPTVRKVTKSGGIQIPGTNVTVKPVTKLPFGIGSSGGSSTSTSTTTGGTIVRDHRKTKVGIPPIVNGSGQGGVTVTETPKKPKGPFGLPLGGVGGVLGTSDGPIVRDHRDPKVGIPPLSGGNGQGGVTVTETPKKPKGPFGLPLGGLGDVLGQNGGPEIRDHRDVKTPWDPSGPLGPIGPVKPPKWPIDPNIPPFEVDPNGGGNTPPADPGGPNNPPMDPGGPTQPPGGGGTPPTNPPMDDHHCHDHFCWPQFGIGLGGYGGWGGYGGGIVTQPVVVNQPVMTSPVVVEQTAPAPEVTTADASIVVEPKDLTKVETGATITINGKGFGSEAGRVGMALGEVLLSAKVVNWTDTAVTIMVPQMELAVPGKAKFLVLKPDGSLATELPFMLMPSAVK